MGIGGNIWIVTLAAGLLLAGCTAVKPREMGMGAEYRLAGSILSVDLKNRSLELTDKGRRHQVAVAVAATIQSGTTALVLADLRRGDRIVVVARDAQSKATWIAVSGPALKRPASGV